MTAQLLAMLPGECDVAPGALLEVCAVEGNRVIVEVVPGQSEGEQSRC